MQNDGNSVLYESWRGSDVPVWASATDGNPGASVVMQGDGNLVVYRGDGVALWDSGTWDNPGSQLVLQDDGNAVVYAPDGRALWASDTYRQSGRAAFDPHQHGFHFDNQFVNNIATIPGFGQIQTFGRCGGMAYAALDYYFAGIPVPAYRGSSFSPSSVPPDEHWLADYIYQRLMNSFFNGSALRFPEWTVHSDHATWFYKGVTRWTKEDEFPKLQAAIDSGTPVVLGLIGAQNLGDVGNKNHQVVAYGYERHPQAGMTVFIYDNVSPDSEVVLSSDAGNPHFSASNRGEAWRGFFVHDYAHNNPPVFTTQPPAPSTQVAHGATIKLGHLRTGRTLHSHSLSYGHPGSSGQQQVTAFDGADDNDLWRVKGPDGMPPDHRAGEPVAHGDVIRLEHVPTGGNLHSHAGHPSPVTEQQEVTCYGQGGIGDGNDNWRVEVDGGVWTASRRIRLIHEATNHALHSHPGWSHPQWTAGQQEVTAYADRDDNDWWSLLEIR